MIFRGDQPSGMCTLMCITASSYRRVLFLLRPTFVTSPPRPPLPLNAVRLRACDRHERVSERRERGRRRGGALG